MERYKKKLNEADEKSYKRAEMDIKDAIKNISFVARDVKINNDKDLKKLQKADQLIADARILLREI